MQNVGEQQFLVLLLMIQAQNNTGPRILGDIAAGKVLHRRIHMMPIRKDLLRRRSRKRRPQLLLRLLGNRVVVAIEEPDEIRMKRTVPRSKFAEHESFEEPGGVRQMPLRWTGVERGLHHHVFGGKRGAKRKAPAPRATEFLGEYCWREYTHWPVLCGSSPAGESGIGLGLPVRVPLPNRGRTYRCANFCRRFIFGIF